MTLHHNHPENVQSYNLLRFPDRDNYTNGPILGYIHPITDNVA